MAEEKVEGSTGAVPAFDATAFMGELEGKIGAMLDARVPQPAQPAVSYPYGAIKPAPAAPAADDPMGTLVDPYVQRAVKPLQEQVAQATIRAQSAEDLARFRAAHPDLSPELAQKVEQAFGRLLEAGTPFVREDVLAWEMGKNFDTYRKEADKREQAERDRVAAAATAGGYSPGVANGINQDFNTMSDEQLALALKGKTF